MWIIMAVLSAVFAGLTSILAKCGIRKTDSDVATALRTVVVLLFSWIMVFIVGSANTITDITAKSLIFLILSGIATGASWICYFKALSVGDVNKVVPVDKSSTVLTVLLAIILFSETNHLAVKLIGTALLAVGIFLMIEKKNADAKQTKAVWLPYAIGSAVFAALTSILAKIGIEGVESNLATAIRTGVVLVMAWLIVLIKGKQKQLKSLDKKELGFIALSGFATGGSWLCYYYAIQNGVVSVVVPIDKMSVVITVVFSYFVFKEKLSRKAVIGLILMVLGTLAMAIWA
ncbi:MAG: EamA family transporter [Lachnospiraceae bacterium]|nr:EamA family transporter [Lachnospiraceae bacterium]